MEFFHVSRGVFWDFSLRHRILGEFRGLSSLLSGHHIFEFSQQL